MYREKILDDAKTIITSDRNNTYGEPEDIFSTIADYWTTYLDIIITPSDVGNMMGLFKIARITANKLHEDSYTDAIGYIACAGELALENKVDN